MKKYENLEDLSDKFVTETATNYSNNNEDNILINKPFNSLKYYHFELPEHLKSLYDFSKTKNLHLVITEKEIDEEDINSVIEDFQPEFKEMKEKGEKKFNLFLKDDYFERHIVGLYFNNIDTALKEFNRLYTIEDLYYEVHRFLYDKLMTFYSTDLIISKIHEKEFNKRAFNKEMNNLVTFLNDVNDDYDENELIECGAIDILLSCMEEVFNI